MCWLCNVKLYLYITAHDDVTYMQVDAVSSQQAKQTFAGLTTSLSFLTFPSAGLV